MNHKRKCHKCGQSYPTKCGRNNHKHHEHGWHAEKQTFCGLTAGKTKRLEEHYPKGSRKWWVGEKTDAERGETGK